MMLRPRIKPEHSGYRTVSGTVRLGSVIYGIGVEIDDPSGWVWTLVQAMDGGRTPDELGRLVAATHPEVTATEVVQAITDLQAAGHLEDTGAPAPELSANERERYSRGVPLLRWLDRSPRPSAWELQELLRAARMLLVGLGGTGGYAAQALVASGVGHLHCVDPDTVELSNLNRQPLYREQDLGRPKVEAALRDLRARNSAVRVTGERRRVGGPAELAELLGSGEGRYDVLLVCADQPPEIRRWANRVCLATGTPWVDAGYHGPLVTAGVHVPGEGACWECLRAGEVERRDLGLAPGQDEEAASPRMPWNPVTAVTAGLSGLLIAHAALALVTGAPPMEPGFRYGINLAALDDTVRQRFPRRPDCPACGTPQEERPDSAAGAAARSDGAGR
ncbi:TOMM precursor leader peptide-binding protein [Kitasatospora sp. NBC_01287]|uniref:TOMM precursor leader peptide-binding protein n=1 Tax=Kitasatospora sp. NBC_01287 TaxID=2903573 RepID=UPI0022562065|nr:TOMM precursor leader peptide-binding protein [Kitasatospora sp. NBC_01287]MCX4744601.1 TOMM precursor leader peptide-binding protein [Kitasatospora sp. NBC_01287]